MVREASQQVVSREPSQQVVSSYVASLTRVFCSIEQSYIIPTQYIESNAAENRDPVNVNTFIMHVLCMFMSRI
jgi:hypothetical protein